MHHNLQFNSLGIGFGKNRLVKEVKGEFSSGRINLVVGRAGVGKSTLLKTIAGFHKDYTGEILYDGSLFEPQGNISLAFQNPEMLFFNSTVGEEVCFALLKRERTTAQAEEEGKAWLHKWGLEPTRFWHKHPLELSGGEKRRVALASCTSFLPPVIMLDEPLAGLDAFGQRSLIKLLDEIASKHIVIVVTHEPEAFLGDCGKILYLRNNQAEWFSSDEFLHEAISSPDFYPLPAWYCHEIGPYSNHRGLPEINSIEVFEFLERHR